MGTRSKTKNAKKLLRKRKRQELLSFLSNPAVWIVTYTAWAYIVNLVNFIHNDFEAPYKSEIVNGIGVFIPPAATITVWF